MKRVGILVLMALAPCTAGARDTPAAAPTQIAFVSTREADSGLGLWLLSDVAAPRYLGKESRVAAVSGDGRLIAYWSRGATRLRVVVSDDTGRRRRIVLSRPLRTQPGQVLLSRDGRTLLATSRSALDTGPMTIERVDVRTGHAQPVRIRCAAYAGVAWALDASRISCLSLDERHVLIADADGRHRFLLPAGASAWLSNGRIAISDSAGTRVTIYDRAGRRAARYHGSVAAVSRNGRLLAISAGSLRIVDDTYRTVRTIARPAWGPNGSTSFSPDASEITYAGVNGAVRITRIGDGTTTRVAGVEWQGTWTLGGAFTFTQTRPNGRLLVREGDHYGRRARTIGSSWADDHGGSEIIPVAGSRVLFFSEYRTHADLWVVHPDGSGLRRLTTGADIGDPSWSPNGNRLAYIRADGPPSGNCGFCSTALTIASPTGHIEQRLIAGDGGTDLAPSWSPDGTAIAVEHNWELIQVIPLASEKRRVVGSPSAHAPAWAPRGSTIAYATARAIRTVASDGTHDRLLLGLRESPSSVAWSPDGRLIVFATSAGIYVAAANGSTTPRRLDVPAGSSSPTFSPDGRSLVFAGRARSGLYVVGIDGGGLRRIVPFVAGAPAWRP